MAANLLLVEDGIFDAVLTQRVLSHCNVEHEVTVARDGAEALAQLKHSRFDVILLDIKMPRVDGFDLLKQLRATPSISHVPVIVVSGSDLQADRLRARTLGAVGYVNKSMDYGEFQSNLQATLRQYGLC